MRQIELPARRVHALDLIDEVIAELRCVHTVMFDSEITNVPMGEEAADVLGIALAKLRPLREALNEELGRS